MQITPRTIVYWLMCSGGCYFAAGFRGAVIGLVFAVLASLIWARIG